MDFTSDGRFLMLNSSGMDMVVVNAETCKKASPKDMKALRYIDNLPLGGFGRNSGGGGQESGKIPMVDSQSAAVVVEQDETHLGFLIAGRDRQQSATCRTFARILCN